MPIRVASAQDAAALDAEAIANGVPSRALMRVAATNAATVIAQRCQDRLHYGVTIFTGPGNNGGDGWCVARALMQLNIPVRVCEVVPARTDDAVAERESVSKYVERTGLHDSVGQGVVIDAMLGTGGTGKLEGAFYDAVAQINLQRSEGAYVVALDVPTGLDATIGTYSSCVTADLTISFGTCKRGLLLARDVCGEIVVVDIGLAPYAGDFLPQLIDPWTAHSFTPTIPFNANKGDRGRIAIVAGNQGMAGAAILSAEGALRSGAGVVKVVTHPNNVVAVHTRLPEALVDFFPQSSDDCDRLAEWADCIVIGPGLGQTSDSRELVDRVLASWNGPLVMDADALNVFHGDLPALSQALRGDQTVITPHPGEFARLIGSDIEHVQGERFDIGLSVARELNATVLLKGNPTVITSPDGDRYVMANGAPSLATGGSGDLLTGMIAAILAHDGVPHAAAAVASWVHASAAERCGAQFLGITLYDIINALKTSWPTDPSRSSQSIQYPVVAELPRVG